MKGITYLLSILIFCLSDTAYSQEFEIFNSKSADQQKNRWSLVDYLLTQKKVALMDQWLALNSDADWFMMKLNYLQGTLERETSNLTGLTETDYKKYAGTAFFKFIGLEYGREEFSDVSKFDFYQIGLLLLGNSIQGSHLMLHGGQRDFDYDATTRFKQPYYGGSLDLYLLKFFGLSGMYRKYSDEVSEDGLFELSSYRTEYTAFIDLLALRIKATVFEEKNNLNSLSSGVSASDTVDTGVYIGGELFL